MYIYHPWLRTTDTSDYLRVGWLANNHVWGRICKNILPRWLYLILSQVAAVGSGTRRCSYWYVKDGRWNAILLELVLKLHRARKTTSKPGWGRQNKLRVASQLFSVKLHLTFVLLAYPDGLWLCVWLQFQFSGWNAHRQFRKLRSKYTQPCHDNFLEVI